MKLQSSSHKTRLTYKGVQYMSKSMPPCNLHIVAASYSSYRKRMLTQTLFLRTIVHPVMTAVGRIFLLLHSNRVQCCVKIHLSLSLRKCCNVLLTSVSASACNNSTCVPPLVTTPQRFELQVGTTVKIIPCSDYPLPLSLYDEANHTLTGIYYKALVTKNPSVEWPDTQRPQT